MTKEFYIVAALLDGRKFRFKTNGLDKLIDLKQRLKQEVEQCESDFHILLNGCILKDDNATTDYYNMSENNSVKIIVRIIGGTQIFILTEDGNRITLEVIPTDTILDIKKKIYERIQVVPEEQRLILGNKTLVDSKTVKESNIMDNVVINIIKRNNIQIVVSTSNGKNFAVDVGKDNRVIDVKRKVELKSGLKASDHDLIYHSLKLEDDEAVLADLDVENNATFFIITKLRGGWSWPVSKWHWIEPEET